MALTSSGVLLINAARFHGVDDLEALFDLLSKDGGPVFVGVVLQPAKVRRVLRQLDDATAEIAAVIGGTRGRRRART